jgi:type I restriction enzyme, S subunit
LSKVIPRKGFKSLFLNKFSVVKANDYPQEWDLIELGNPKSGFFLNGINKDKEDYGEGCLFVNISDVFREFTINPKKLKRVRVSEKEIIQYGLEKGDLILDRSSNIFPTVGYPSNFNGADEPVVFSGFTFRFRPNPKIWNSKFLTLMLMSTPIRKLVISIATQSANSNVNQKSYKKILIPNPSISEQNKIFEIISSIDELIINTQKIIEQSEFFKKGMIHELFTKGINHTKFKKTNWYFGKQIDIPDTWIDFRIGDMIKFVGGSQPAKKNFLYKLTPGHIRLMQIRDFKSDKYKTYISINSTKKFFKKDDVMIGRYGPPNFQILRGLEGAYNVALIKAIPIKTGKDFLYYFLKQKKFFNIMDSLGKRTAGQDGVELDVLKKLPFPLPPKEEEEKISTILLDIDSKITSEEQYKENLLLLKKSLMQKLLTGEVRV